jgi:hypothetical protein
VQYCHYLAQGYLKAPYCDQHQPLDLEVHQLHLVSEHAADLIELMEVVLSQKE